MAVQGITFALGSSSATSIAGASLHGTLRVRVRNLGSGVAYLGSSAASTAAGFQLTTADAPHDVVLFVGEELYAYSTGTPTISVLRVNETT